MSDAHATHEGPHILPDGRTVLFGVMSVQEDGSVDQEIAVTGTVP